MARPAQPNDLTFFATAAKGTEPALRDELRELRLPSVRCDRGGVHFGGSWEDAWRVCLHARVALKVFHPLGSFRAGSAEALYDGVRALDWRGYLSPRHSLAVTAWCRDSALTHSNFVALKVKDAIVDAQRDRLGNRSSVDRKDPDLPVFVHLVRDQATVYLDLVGESLHRRGYRRRTVEAPLKESLAAAVLRLSGWDRRRPFVDPMCGSGTLAIEAALWSRNVPPGLSRERFAFQRWPGFDAAARSRLAALRQSAEQAIRTEGPEVRGADLDEGALQSARANARAAGARVHFERRSVFEQPPLDPPGMIVTNPPYGERLPAERDFYRELGQALRKLHRHRLGILLTQRRHERELGLKAERFWILYNGDLECRLMAYEIR